MYIYIYIYIYIYSLRKSNIYLLKSAQQKSVIILWEEGEMQNKFTWYLKFHAGGPTLFQPGTTVIKKWYQYNGILIMTSFI